MILNIIEYQYNFIFIFYGFLKTEYLNKIGKKLFF